jgi:hypothetical protein
VETTLVVDKMGDDHFDDLLREPGGRGRGCCRKNVVRTIRRTHSLDPTPNSFDDWLNHYSGNRDQTKLRGVGGIAT